MNASFKSAQLHAALRFVVTSDITAEHKAVLIEVLRHALREQEEVDLRRQSAEREQEEWQPHETLELQTFLAGKSAKNWQHADEHVMQLAARLHRTPRSIRTKAAELGLAAAVDYQYAKARAQAGAE